MLGKLFSGIEGGTKYNCEVGNSPENIIDEAQQFLLQNAIENWLSRYAATMNIATTRPPEHT